MPPETPKPAEQSDASKELAEHIRTSLEDDEVDEQERQKLEQLAEEAREMADQSKETADALRTAIRDVARERYISERKLLTLIWGEDAINKTNVASYLSPFSEFTKIQDAGVPPMVLQCVCENYVEEHSIRNTQDLQDVFEHYAQFQGENYAESLLLRATDILPYYAGLFIGKLDDVALAERLVARLEQTAPEYAVQFLEMIDEARRDDLLTRALMENPRLLFDSGTLLQRLGYDEFLYRATLALADQSTYHLFKKFDEWKEREHPEGKQYLNEVLTVVYRTGTSSFFENIAKLENETGAEKLIYEATMYAADQLPELVFKNLTNIEGRKSSKGKLYTDEAIARAARTAADIQQRVFFANIAVIEKTIDARTFETLLYNAATNAADGDPGVALAKVARFKDKKHEGEPYAAVVVRRAAENAMVTSPGIVAANFSRIAEIIGEEEALTLIDSVLKQSPEAIIKNFSLLEKAKDTERVQKIFEVAMQRVPQVAFESVEEVIRRPSERYKNFTTKSPAYVDTAYLGIVEKTPGTALRAYEKGQQELHSYPDGLLQRAATLSVSKDPFALLEFLPKSEMSKVEFVDGEIKRTVERVVKISEQEIKSAVKKAMEQDGYRFYSLYQQEKDRLSKFVSEQDVASAFVESARKQPLRVLDDSSIDLSIFDADTLHEIVERAFKENPFIHVLYEKEIRALDTYSDLQELQETLQAYVARVHEPMDTPKRQETIQEVLAHVLEDADRFAAFSEGVDMFNNDTGLSLECRGIRGEPLQFVLINTFTNRDSQQAAGNMLPVCLTVSYTEMVGVKSSEDIVQLLHDKYAQEQEQYAEQRSAWSKVYARMENGIPSFEPDEKTAVLIESIHGGVLERDMPAILDLYESKGARPFAVCTNNMSQWELQVNGPRKQQGKSVLEVRSGTEKSKLDTWTEFLQKSVEDPSIDKVLIHYKAHGLESGVTKAEGSDVAGTELARALMAPFEASDPNDPRNGKQLSSLIPVMILPMTCHPGRQMNLMNKRLREMKAAKDVSMFAPGNYEVTQGGDGVDEFTKYSVVAETTRDMRGNRAVFTYYLLQYFEMLEDVDNPQPPLGTMVHALHHASRMSEQDSAFGQKPIGHRLSEEHSIDERVSKVEQQKFSVDEDEQMLA